MKPLGYTLHAATIASVLGAIWTGHTWQFALTGLVLFLAGAAILGSEGLKRHGTPQNSARSEREGANGGQDSTDETKPAPSAYRNTYGRKAGDE